MLKEWESFDRPLIDKIDKVLFILRDNLDGLNTSEIFNNLTKQEITIQHPELDALLQKLVKDGYAVFGKLLRTHVFEGYKITYDGLMFAWSGAYYATEWVKERDWELVREQEKYLRDSLNKQIETLEAQVKSMEDSSKIQRGMNRLTLWIAFGTIIAAIYYTLQVGIYIVQQTQHLPSCNP